MGCNENFSSILISDTKIRFLLVHAGWNGCQRTRLSVKIETTDSAAVGIPPKWLHGSIYMREKGGEGGDPVVAKLLHGSKGQPHLRSKCVIVVGHVPHKSEQVNNGGGRVAPPLLGVSPHLLL